MKHNKRWNMILWEPFYPENCTKCLPQNEQSNEETNKRDYVISLLPGIDCGELELLGDK